LQYTISLRVNWFFKTVVALLIAITMPNIVAAQPCSPSLTFTISATLVVACNGDCTAQIAVSGGGAVTGGVGPYNFLWAPGGETTPFIVGLCAGNYTLTVTDVGGGCDTSTTLTVTEPDLVEANFTTIDACFGQCTGIANLTASGGGGGPGSPYTYTWTNLTTTTTQTGTVDQTLPFTGLCPGNYSIDLVDPLGCTGSGTVTVSQASSPVSAVMSGQDVTCYGDCDGNVSVALSGSYGPYDLVWSNGATSANQASSSILPQLCAGTYNVTVTDSIGCINTGSQTITEPPPFNASTSKTDPSCSGQCDGTAAVTSFSGGTSGYNYAWSSGQSSSSVTGLCEGNTYTVTVTDSKGCDTTMSFIMSSSSTMTSTAVASATETCAGNLNVATATVTASGGTTPYTYLWSTSATTSTVTGLTVGEVYTVEVFDNNNCSTSTSVLVTPEFCDPEVHNTFTPNGDGLNDTWEIKHLKAYTECKVKIYNRWGDIVYKSTGYDKPWDGKALKVPLPSAVYYYVIVVDEIGKTYNGSVTIVR